MTDPTVLVILALLTAALIFVVVMEARRRGSQRVDARKRNVDPNVVTALRDFDDAINGARPKRGRTNQRP